MSVGPSLIPAVETMEGDKVIVKRLFPVAGLRNHDPFVLWDHFEVAAGSGFPPHPHRGFEAITYLFSGNMSHEDNLGNSSIIGPGGAQRFSAGKGIIHSEMSGGEEPARGIQLWINLPKRLKHIDPDYQETAAAEITFERKRSQVNYSKHYWRKRSGTTANSSCLLRTYHGSRQHLSMVTTKRI
jgi:redox-sensitive bicupin YhaK (pirin superfamily)